MKNTEKLVTLPPLEADTSRSREYLLVKEKQEIPYDGNWLFACKAEYFIDLSENSEVLVGTLEERYGLLFPNEDSPTPEEKESWRNSFPALAKVMRQAKLKEQLIILEYCIPTGNFLPKRIDATICGTDRKGALNAVIIELKQWSSLHMRGDNDPNYIQIRQQGEWNRKLHPRRQAEIYREKIEELLQLFELPPDFINFSAYAYLHNIVDISEEKRDVLFGEQKHFNSDSRLYTRKYSQAFAKRLKEQVGNGGAEIAFVAFQEIQRLAAQNIQTLPKCHNTIMCEQRLARKALIKNLHAS